MEKEQDGGQSTGIAGTWSHRKRPLSQKSECLILRLDRSVPWERWASHSHGHPLLIFACGCQNDLSQGLRGPEHLLPLAS